MNLPAPVNDYLMQLLAQQRAPFAAQVSHRWQVIDVFGNPEAHGLPALQIGTDLRDTLPFLHGQSPTEPFVLPMIAINDDHVFNIHCVPSGDLTYLLLLPVDEERDMRRSLQQKANEVRLLNYRQQRLVEQLSTTKEELERREQALMRANEIKARFIAGMSHEFRTPLTAILGYAELLEDNTTMLLKEADDMNAHVGSIGRAARHLLSMVDNILDQARLDEGDVVLSPIRLAVRDLIDDLAAIVAPLAAARFLGFGAFVDPAVPDAVLIDAVRLRQILLNLLGNAVKFTEQGRVQLDVGWQGGQLVFAVHDTGPGIAKDEQDSIFDEFKRGAGSDDVRGVGLGLNIARRLCELLGGRIDLESTVGEGSVFTVTMPVATAPAQSESGEPDSAQSAAPASGSAGARILVAEDDPDIIDLVQIILDRADYDVHIAMNGLDAVEQALAMKPDLVLMDVNMPKMTGMEAASEMRRHGIRCPIIALSASLGIDDRDGALEAGYDTYLVKPIARGDLLRAIAVHLEHAE